MEYLQYSFSIADEQVAEILVVELAELGFESFDREKTLSNAYVQSHLVDDQITCSIEKLFERYQVDYLRTVIPDQHWNQKWEQNFEPVVVEDICWVGASFHQKAVQYPFQIVIDPQMAFGTAHHPTTYLVISEMLKIDLKGKLVGDLGCGTGILAVLASLKGASNVIAVDIADESVQSAQRNAEINKIQNMQVGKGSIDQMGNKPFDVLFANINRNTIIELLPAIKSNMAQDGIIFFSGFFNTDTALIIEKSSQLAIQHLATKCKGDWALLAMKNNLTL